MPKSKYKRCEKCGLKIRCGNQKRHEAGYSHKRRLETLKERARKAAMSGN